MDKHDAPADALGLAAEAAEKAADMLPLDMVAAVADLVDPAAVAREMPWLAGELTKVALGQSDVSFDERDQRFVSGERTAEGSYRVRNGIESCIARILSCWLIIIPPKVLPNRAPHFGQLAMLGLNGPSDTSKPHPEHTQTDTLWPPNPGPPPPGMPPFGIPG